MPRRSRIMLADIPVHVVQRGNNRQRCFYQEQDRAFYLFHLRRLLHRTGCKLHAYCLMTNHVHLLLTASASEACSRLMKDLGQLHTQYMNRNYDRSGSLWEGRFRSCVVQAEDYLLACYRYIEMNPVRASLVLHPEDHAWSSYRANAQGISDPLITPHEEYSRYCGTEGRTAYARLVAQVLHSALIDEIRTATNGNFALGDKSFRARVSAALGRRAEPGRAGRPRSSERFENQPQLPGLAVKNVVCP